ncbi:secretion protein [Tenacibaculum sp. Bg11-29]|uniref:reprolysin-like metallopeptidase n=1 Tax=Tenacibaculum sp. Bg11-29 TaxID=2058306 RepID=UPI000C330163|nr:zinc-dependent metalloprotease family protein [Tenacibaculum sp. Bg11-29]PKH51149.1 secretion protein [Tenacibaculum sp. Bg11-29]
MKNKLFLAMCMASTILFSQNSNFWKQDNSQRSNASKSALEKKLPDKEIYNLDLKGLKKALVKAPKRNFNKKSTLIISFPNSEGRLERYYVSEASVLHPDLAKKFPNIKSYSGTGVDNPLEKIRFSISPKGLQSIRLVADKPAVFIEPYSKDLKKYTIYKRLDKPKDVEGFKCDVKPGDRKSRKGTNTSEKNADDGMLRTYRLAISTTGEYTAYHGGSKAQALAAMNATMTRVNAIYESDFNVTMVLIANTDAVIYTDAATDPYTGSFNSQLQATLTSVIGEANYDIGHLFAKAGNNGNAGCIGCVCVDGNKGSGFTSHTIPAGDAFDVDFVAHEMGHQFGGNHTWTHGGNEGKNVQMEPGSGTTIMGYAGITGATDVQPHSDPYFHAATIAQVTDYIKSTSCQTNTPTGNTTPVANAGSDYTIPKGTSFVLNGVGTDADAADILTYSWEQMDENGASSTYPSTTATSGVAFRSYSPTTNPSRYFPRLETIKSGNTSWKWEAVPSVARVLNFRLSVRDNRVGGGSNNSDDMKVTVNGSAGPFVVNSPNSNVTLSSGVTETVAWSVAGTTGNGINAATVDILLSTDGGDTYPITLASNVTNDGSHNVIIPNVLGTENRIMVKGSNHIFFDISNANFTISSPQSCTAVVPTGLLVGNVSDIGAIASWNEVLGAAYQIEYKKITDSSWSSSNTSGTSFVMANLEATTNYEVRVKAVCSDGNMSDFTSIVDFTTTEVQITYCDAKSTNINDEFIGSVKLNTIDNTSSGQFYSDFTSISTTVARGAVQEITITPTWTGGSYNEGYAVWIDYNKNGSFSDTGELVWSKSQSKDTPVVGNFTVPTTAVLGDTRMRVAMQYDAIPSPCGDLNYGEVEDYTVNITGDAIVDTEVPVLTLLGDSVVSLNIGDAYTDLGASALDNIDGDISGNIVTTGAVDVNAAGTYTLTYNVSDAADNVAVSIIRTVNVNEVFTGCVNGINSYPYAESFDNSFGLWTQSSNDDVNWRRKKGATPSGGTGPTSATDGARYIYVEASVRKTGYPNKKAILNSPCYDLSGLSSATISFQYHMYGADDMGTIALEISEDNGVSWNSIWNQSGNKGNSWLSASISLNDYVEKGVQLRFNRVTGGSWKADIAIDKFEITAVNTASIVSRENEKNEEVIRFSVYPNPVSNQINIIKPVGLKTVNYGIYNSLGQEVKKGKTFNSIDVSDLQSSIYTIIFKEYKSAKSIRFIKK